ncbi:MAG TPA: mannose-1-phosphate guanylyltransferase/mannose-6-phosphate isomerase [Burkholderiales bacterium]|nr:mannose-1-phosphate guanylyltransferase/mannose-6-phosphate isomerase [Burkholderiales bacterium]
MIELGLTPTLIQPVILCGGSGTRLWPLSRENEPKQLHALNGERTLLQQTALRCGALSATAEPILVCNEAHRFMIAEQLRRAGAKPKSVLLEPAGRGTAPALTLAAVHAITADDPVLLAMPSDHAMADTAAFARAVEQGAALAQQGYVVTFGIPPQSAETGYGYIRSGRAVAGAPGAAYVEAFVEKPDAALAREYFESGRFFWNSGIFAVRASVWIEAIGAWRADILKACERAHRNGKRDGAFFRVEPQSFVACPADSIDYAVMERIANGPGSPEAVVVELEAGWSDVGAWDALWAIEDKDADGNVVHGDVRTRDTRNSLVISKHRLVTCVGLEDVVVVETPDAVMVAKKDKAQALGPVVAELKAAGREECFAHRKVLRPWGSYDGIERGERFQVKRIVVEPGAALSLQLHYHRAEHWIVVQGTARVTRGEETFLLTENESTYIPPGTRHRLENPGKMPLELIEVQSGSYLGEDDIVRFDDVYGRSNSGSEPELPARSSPPATKN